MNLKKLRKAVDRIDEDVLALLNKRAEIIIDIGKKKTRDNHPAYVPDREAEVYKHVISSNKGPLPGSTVAAVFREIMSGSLSLEKPLTIAYLGPEFTFTHLASITKFGSSVSYSSCETIKDVFSDVEKGRSDYGVVPIENSIEGAVNYTLDMFIDSDLKICSEIFFEVSHNLLSREKDKNNIKKVYSKAEVFGQCRLWLEANLPGVELLQVSSTAKAAQIASCEKGSACIASEAAGKKYKLYTLSKSIEDSSRNVTRFLVIGKEDAKSTKNDKTSIVMSTKDKVGVLHDILVPFKKYGINLTKIESRPSKAAAWQYYFFVDLEGHHSDKKIAKALDFVKNETTYFKILGSYPAGIGF